MIQLLKKYWRKFINQKRFFLEQKTGWVKPKDPFAISKSILKKYLPADAVIIDCGAHIGADSVELAKVFSKGTIHSFEPIPQVYKELKKNTTAFENIKIYQLALSNSDGAASMFVSSGHSDGSSSLLAPASHLSDHPEVLFEEKIEVNTKTLDTWANENGISRVDFLWLDMQGFEFSMLEKSYSILPTVKAIYSEVSLKETYKDCMLYNDYRKWLESKGFTVAKEIILENADMGNVLFVRL